MLISAAEKFRTTNVHVNVVIPMEILILWVDDYSQFFSILEKIYSFFSAEYNLILFIV